MTKDPARAFEAAVRAARATSHSHRLDAATQAALNAYADALTAMVDYAVSLKARIAALEVLESHRVHHDP